MQIFMTKILIKRKISGTYSKLFDGLRPSCRLRGLDQLHRVLRKIFTSRPAIDRHCLWGRIAVSANHIIQTPERKIGSAVTSKLAMHHERIDESQRGMPERSRQPAHDLESEPLP